MQPIYFPHTYITDATFQALSTCFQNITVYQPILRHFPNSMVQWRDTGQLQIRCPVHEFETDIESSLKSYQFLGEMYLGRKGELKNFQPSSIPYFDDTSPHKIRADIIREMRGLDPRDNCRPPSTAHLIQAALFLQMAQDLDARQDGIRRDMEACAGMEKNLFKTLKEDDDPLFEELAFTPSPPAGLPGEHRLKKRLSAWTRLFFHDLLVNTEGGKWPRLPLLFITSSRFLFDEIVAAETDNAVFFSLEPKSVKQSSFLSILTDMARAKDPASVREVNVPFQEDAPASIKIAVIFHEPPLSFLAKRSGMMPVDVPDLPGPERQPNTLLGLVSGEPGGHNK